MSFCIVLKNQYCYTKYGLSKQLFWIAMQMKMFSDKRKNS